MNFADRITRLPLPLDPVRGQGALARIGPQPDPIAALISGAAGSSPYLSASIDHEYQWLAGHLASVPDPVGLVGHALAGLDDLAPDALGPALRIAKRRTALMVALADLGGIWTLESVCLALTELADRATDLAFRAHLRAEVGRGKIPGHEADCAGLIVLAMGKMGAYELNYSSDIDLIVLFDDGAYAPADRPLARAGLIRVTRRAAATLSDITDQGYVFRTDLRLRPDASAMPVCISAAAALAYYEAEGRSWERAAYIKARPCAGNLAAGQDFLRQLRPFVWRRHLDFAAIEDAYSMRQKIRDHNRLHGAINARGHDIKLGRGGIREIEFFTQTQQLISGGRDPSLRVRGTVAGLSALADAGWIAREKADALAGLYRDHRLLEHRIQMVNDARSHELPIGGAALDAVARLAAAPDTKVWTDAVTRSLAQVEALTEDFFVPEAGEPRPELSHDQQALIETWAGYPALRTTRARRVFRRIEGDLLRRMGRAANPGEALARFDGFLRGLPSGVQIFSLFEANPQLIDLIVDICATAPRLALYLADHSGVLDSVIAGRFFSRWPGKEGMRHLLSEALSAAFHAPQGGYERVLDAARRFAHEWQFRIGVHHLRGLVDGGEAASQYADLADAIVAVLTGYVALEFARRHGPPPGRGAVVLGMGSFGSRRLNVASDLDLIVVYDAAGISGSDGPKPLAARSYYTRFTKSLITALSVPTSEGRLYEVDMRLRPSGRQGPLATSLAAFEGYQLDEAWLWEHLALTCARAQASIGSNGAALARQVEDLRRAVLKQRGTDARVLPDLAEMRRRLFAMDRPDGMWEVKIGRGGLQDIALFAQSLALRAGSPVRNVVAQLYCGARAGLISRTDSLSLTNAHRFLWRFLAGRRLLTDLPLDMNHVGSGGRAFLLREAGAENIAALTAQLHDVTQSAGDIIDRHMQQAQG